MTTVVPPSLTHPVILCGTNIHTAALPLLSKKTSEMCRTGSVSYSGERESRNPSLRAMFWTERMELAWMMRTRKKSSLQNCVSGQCAASFMSMLRQMRCHTPGKTPVH